MLHQVKFSSEDWGTCPLRSQHNASVATDLGLIFVSVILQDTYPYRH